MAVFMATAALMGMEMFMLMRMYMVILERKNRSNP